MDEILKKMDAAFRLISIISVSGDSVDVMAEAKNNLRQAYAELVRRTKEETNG